jgi:hypothetical protein
MGATLSKLVQEHKLLSTAVVLSCATGDFKDDVLKEFFGERRMQREVAWGLRHVSGCSTACRRQLAMVQMTDAHMALPHGRRVVSSTSSSLALAFADVATLTCWSCSLDVLGHGCEASSWPHSHGCMSPHLHQLLHVQWQRDGHGYASLLMQLLVRPAAN